MIAARCTDPYTPLRCDVVIRENSAKFNGITLALVRLRTAVRMVRNGLCEGEEVMRTRIATLIAGVALLGTITFAQSINYDFDKSANFKAFRTYTWVRGAAVPDALTNQRIVGAINAQLAARGLRLVERQANPDLLIAYHAAFDADLQISGFGSGWGGFRFPGSYSGTVRANEIVTGTLIVDMVDADTRTIVWRGTATKEIDPKAKPEQRDKNINRAAAKLLKNYPPAK
jgi:hypothetical protein